MNYMNYDYNYDFKLFKFQSGYRKFYVNSPKDYHLQIINAQTVYDIQTALQTRSKYDSNKNIRKIPFCAPHDQIAAECL